MSVDEFAALCKVAQPPEALPEALRALYWDARGDWNQAHKVAQAATTPEGSLVHAYLHRKEGDQGNARYWYDRAGRPVHKGTLAEEWRAIASELCERTRA
jgi:hypothetical protein